MSSEANTPTRVYTVGHSTHAIEDFLELLRMHSVELLVDVRRFPGSRRLPHFNSEPLKGELDARGIAYIHAEGLGGRRKLEGDSTRGAWKSASFQAYAEHMKTSEFAESLNTLIGEASKRTTAVMCAEGLWWKCHRRLIADALSAKGLGVLHILPAGEVEGHKLPDFAEVDQGVLFYET
jgi:uncharacterized protein (DUF488 family)